MYAAMPPPQQAPRWDSHAHHTQHQYRMPSTMPPPGPAANPQYAHPPAQQHLSQLAQPSQSRPDRPEVAPLQIHNHQQQQYQQQQGPEYRLPPMQPPRYYESQPVVLLGALHQQPQHQPATTSAPRQRTAIACKYCRRRKIRCSGFENSEDGRCTNCVRFSQECIFTPVSAQTQAFVSAQALEYARGRASAAGTSANAAPVQFYGSYGQPLPRSEQYEHRQGVAPQTASAPASYTLPSPTSAYPPGSQYSPSNQYPPGYPQSESHFAHPDSIPANRRRRNEEPHTPTIAPPNPAHAAFLTRRDTDHSYSSSEQVSYSGSTGISPASSTTSHAFHPAYYTSQLPPVRRPSPYSASYPSEQLQQHVSQLSHSSSEDSSPSGQAYYANGHPHHMAHLISKHSTASSVGSSVPTSTTTDNRTPPTPHTPMMSTEHDSKPINPMSIAGLVDLGPVRSAADNDMVSALNHPRKL